MTSPYFYFGERDEDGDAIVRSAGEYTPIIHSYMCEREASLVSVETMLRMQMDQVDKDQKIIEECNAKVDLANRACKAVIEKNEALKERIKLLHEPQKMEDQLLGMTGWAQTLRKTIVLMQNNMGEDHKEKVRLKEENARLEKR